MPKFTNENWGQAFRMYCNTTAWGYNPTYKKSGDRHTVTWEKNNEQNKTKHTQRIKAVVQLSFFTAQHKQDRVCGKREANQYEQESVKDDECYISNRKLFYSTNPTTVGRKLSRKICGSFRS